MDPELLDSNLVFAKTAAGEEAMLQRTRVVQRNVRMVLILVDGNATVAELCDKTGNTQLTQNALLELEGDGFVERRVETGSVWRHGKQAPKKKTVSTPQPVSEFSTFGERLEAPPAGSGFSHSLATQIVAPPDEHTGRQAQTPSTLTPTPLAPGTSTPGPWPSRPGYRTPVAASPATQPPATPDDEQGGKGGLPARLRRLFGFGGTADQPDIKRLRPGRRRWSLTWTSTAALGILLISAVLSLIALFFPYTDYLPQVEAALAQSTGQPAKVGSMRVSVYPKPGLLLLDLHLGDSTDGIQIGTLRLQPEISTLLSPRIIFRQAELHDVRLSAGTVAGLSRMLESTARQSARAGVLQVSVVDATFSFAELALDDLGGEFALSADHQLETVVLRSRNKSLQLDLKPTARGLAVRLEGVAWRPAQDSPYIFDSLDLQGEIIASEFVIDTVEARIFDGLVRAATLLRSGGKAAMAGELRFERINARKLSEALGLGNRLEGEAKGKLSFSASADTWPELLSRLQGYGSFTIHRGQLGGLDLPEAVRRVSTDPQILGGATRFEELSGTITLTPTVYRFSRLALSAGLMQSSGHIEVDRDLQLHGRMDVAMRGRADQKAMPITISGTLESPLTQTAGR